MAEEIKVAQVPGPNEIPDSSPKKPSQEVGGLDDLLADFSDDDLELPVPGGAPLVVSGGSGPPEAPAAAQLEDPSEEEKKEEEQDLNEHRLEFEGIEITRDDDDNKVYRNSTLNTTVNNAQASNLTGVRSNLGIRKVKDQVMDEVEFWGKLKHDNIVKAFIWYEDYNPDPHNKMYLMLQYADMGQIADWDSQSHSYTVNQIMFDYLSRKLTDEAEFTQFGLPESDTMIERVARFVFQQAASGLEYLHEEAFVANRDVKPENMLFTTKQGGTNIYKHDRAQITDFTTVFKMEPETAEIVRISGFQGSEAFSAPEVWNSVEFRPRPLDVWAFGVSIYAFMFGEMPFWGENEAEIRNEIKTKEINYDDKPVSEEFKEMMRALLAKNPDERPSMRQAIAQFKWLQRPIFPSEKPPAEEVDEDSKSEEDF